MRDSDIAFFINPKEAHGFGTLFLSSLVECAGLQQLNSLDLICPPLREEVTTSGKRIDLIIEGEQWVLVIENKLQHYLNNPFDKYVHYISKKYSQKQQCFILLTIRDELPPEGWINITYKKFIDQLKQNIGHFMMNPNTTKWYVILREFILNMQEQISKDQVDPTRIKFIMDNYSEIQEIIDMHNEYIEYIKSLIINTIATNDSNSIRIRQHNWGDVGIALRVSLEHWQKETNITLVLKKDGGLRIQIYIYDVQGSVLELLKEYIDSEKYNDFWIESTTIGCFGFFDSSHLEEILDEMKDVAKQVNAFYEELKKELT